MIKVYAKSSEIIRVDFSIFQALQEVKHKISNLCKLKEIWENIIKN